MNTIDSRPILDKNIPIEDFREFYWLKEELVAFCRANGISTSGGKMEVTQRIDRYLCTGSAPEIVRVINKSKSTFNWAVEPLSLTTVITDSYKNSENVRSFFREHIGKHFSFNVKFMNWMKENAGKTLGDAVEEWLRISEQSKSKDYRTEIAPQFEYNRYIRAFLADNPSMTTNDAIRCWNIKRLMRGSNEYERKDLDLR